MDEQKQPQDPFNIPYHLHNGSDSPQLNPKDFLGFPVITVSDATVAPTDTPISGTIRFLKDSSNYYEWVRFGQEWKGISIGVSGIYELLANKKTTMTDDDDDYASTSAIVDYVSSKVPDYRASDDLLYKMPDIPAGISKTGTTPQKALEITCPVEGTLRIKYQGATASYIGYGSIYQNGSAVGGTIVFPATGAVVTGQQDISGWSIGDKIQIYLWSSNASGAVSLYQYGAWAEGRITAVYGTNAPEWSSTY